MDRVRLNQIAAIATEAIKPLGFECIEVEWDYKGRILRIFVDLLEGADALGMDECLKASHALVDLPALDDAVSGEYTLEVSSPGIERPLRFDRHFRRVVGRDVEVSVKDASGRRRKLKGKLANVSGEGDSALVLVRTPEGDRELPLCSLQSAHLVYDWSKNSSNQQNSHI